MVISTIHYVNYSSYYSLFLILIGLLLCLLLKFGSDFSLSERNIVIGCDDYSGADISRMDSSGLLKAIDAGIEANDNRSIIGGLPLRIKELKFADKNPNHGTFGIKYYVNSLISLNERVTAYKDMVWRGSEANSYRWFVARIVYDSIIEQGLFSIRIHDNISGLLLRNSIFIGKELQIINMQQKRDRKFLNIVNLNDQEKRVFEYKKTILAKGNSLLLFLLLNDLVRVINC